MKSKLKTILFLSLMSALLVGCSDDKGNENPNDNLTPNQNPDQVENNVDAGPAQEDSEGLGMEDMDENAAPFDTNVAAGFGATIPPLESFDPAYTYPVDNSKSRYSREVRDILAEDAGWWLSDYEDNHSVFVSQDSNNEYKTTTKHGLLIFDNDHGIRDKEWTNHYFKGVYFNTKTSQYEFKFVIDSKSEDFLSVGLNSLILEGVNIPQDAIKFDTNKTVKYDNANLFTITVDYKQGYPLEINTMSFNYEIYDYNSETVTEVDSNPKEIFMELSR